MTKREHLLTCLVEECLEVGQRATKALRFGIEEVQPGQPFANSERIKLEYADLTAIYDLCMAEGLLRAPTSDQIAAKKAKFLKFLEYSESVGTVVK